MPSESIADPHSRRMPDAQPKPADSDHADHENPLAARRGLVLLVGIVFVVAILARLVLARRSYEVGMDEIQYADVGRSVRAGDGLKLFGATVILPFPRCIATAIQGATRPVNPRRITEAGSRSLRGRHMCGPGYGCAVHS
jgi:hypothetical protein